MDLLSPELSDAPWPSLLHFHLLLAEQVLFKFGLSRSLDLLVMNLIDKLLRTML
jgi:hypothetical protein